tara:strand:+ start:952 stop:1110 length:159 start_codon:yes stop_codon:yes gene_type:complete
VLHLLVEFRIREIVLEMKALETDPGYGFFMQSISDLIAEKLFLSFWFQIGEE